jgi:hypothetical protein
MIAVNDNAGLYKLVKKKMTEGINRLDQERPEPANLDFSHLP